MEMQNVLIKLHHENTRNIVVLKVVNILSKSELNAFFRNEDHPKYMECGDQILRNFLNGLIIHLRGPMPKKGEAQKTNPNKNKKKSNN